MYDWNLTVNKYFLKVHQINNYGVQIMSNQDQFILTIAINKKIEKSNITFSISQLENGDFVSANFTGSIVEASGLTYVDEDGESYNYNKDLKGLECLLLVDSLNLAESAISSAKDIFTNRIGREDKNHRIYFNVIASGFQLKLQDEEEENDQNRSKLIITKISSINVKGKLSVSAFKERLATLKARSSARRVKTRSSGLFNSQLEVIKTNTENIDIKSNDTSSELPTREEMFKEMMLMKQQMSQLQSKLSTKSSNSNGGSKELVVKDVNELVGS